MPDGSDAAGLSFVTQGFRCGSLGGHRIHEQGTSTRFMNKTHDSGAHTAPQ
eukprot:m.579084 g.579084  ORF g.579084 m.579084 type:complete len:51 (+) comp22311_c0_seq1:116-268(+)